jgi:hypothetical protein
MHYQVVAKALGPEEPWDYYPHWAPLSDKPAAERLANYAAQSGWEAAILAYDTAELLEMMARRVVEGQDTQLLPALRYLPVAQASPVEGGREKHDVEIAFSPSESASPYDEGPDKSELDRRRLELELGPGGDVTAGAEARFGRLSLPLKMDVIRLWLRLHQRVTHGQVGGPTDGAQDGRQDGAPDEHTGVA